VLPNVLRQGWAADRALDEKIDRKLDYDRDRLAKAPSLKMVHEYGRLQFRTGSGIRPQALTTV